MVLYLELYGNKWKQVFIECLFTCVLIFSNENQLKNNEFNSFIFLLFTYLFFIIFKNQDQKRIQERRRHLLYLIATYLQDHGYSRSSDMLSSEAQLSDDIQICDNIDLDIILMEYDAYYYTKFNRYPVLCKNVVTKCPTKKQNTHESKNMSKNDAEKGKNVQQTNFTSKDNINLAMTITPLLSSESDNHLSINEIPKRSIRSNISKIIEDLYPTDSELRKIADIISKEIVLTNLNVHWDDVIGLDKCKAAVREAAVYPLNYPVFFQGKFSPWQGILLYGPPGTGKTMLAKAVATECNCTFFNITASSLVSKWRGDSEKYIRVLFDLAYSQSPTVIFIDEIDWISTTGNIDSVSEPARRFRAELLARLDGLVSIENSNILLLATTNVPWTIDAALLRRLEKRIYVELPNSHARLSMFNYYVSDKLKTSNNIVKIVEATKDYSGADIKMLCKEAWILQIYPTWKLIESKKTSVLDVNYEITDIEYLKTALQNIKPSTKHLLKRYDNFHKCLIGEYNEENKEQNQEKAKRANAQGQGTSVAKVEGIMSLF
ncbi:katanin p60 ATPase-containing subunit A-like 2 [Calliopsis andreniformis]|uniref:katanin p60 ATPase-containing subunit A-like 2 n=1 Tax=Calliopsis andreniformis TaxID=337506 RepID=UPI003FCCF309